MGAVNSLNQLSEILQHLIGVDMAPQHTDPRPGDIRHSFADVTKAAELLQFEPHISVLEGLDATIAWYRTRVAAADPK